MSFLSRGTLLAAALAAGLVACKTPPPPPATVYIEIHDEAKAPVKDVEVMAQGQVIAQTGADGRAEVHLTGREGTTFPVEVHCPAGFRSPTQTLAVRRLENAASKPPTYVTQCYRMRHTVVIDVKTVGAPDMPVLRLGQPVGHTDGGVAQVTIEGDVDERIELQLDTSDPRFARVHPQSPTGSFVIRNQDDHVSFDMRFTVDKPPVVRRKAKKGPVQVN